MAGMPRILSVALADGVTLGPLATDNRDAVRWDRHRATRRWPAAQDAPMLWVTYLAWAAAQRTGQTTLTYEDWEEQVVTLEIDTDSMGLPDPTRQGAGPASS